MDLKIKYKNLYLSIVFPIYVMANILSASNFAFSPDGGVNTFQLILKLIRYSIYLISILYTFSRHPKKQTAFYAVIVLGVVLISLAVNHNVQLICSLFVFCALLDYPWEKIVAYHVISMLIVSTIIVGLSQLGIIEDFIRIEANRPDRHFLGFNWATYASVIWFFITLGFCCIKKGKLKLISAIILAGIATILYRLTDTRLSYVISLIAIVFFLVYKRDLNYKKNLVKLTKVTFIFPIVCAAASIIVHAVYSPQNAFLANLNNMLTQRLYFGHEAIAEYGIKIIGGQPIEWQGFDMTTLTFEGYNYVDCSYLHLLLEYGLVFLVVFLCLLTYGIYRAYKNEQYYLCWILGFLCIYGMIEPWLLNFTFNPFMWSGVALFSAKQETQQAFLATTT